MAPIGVEQIVMRAEGDPGGESEKGRRQNQEPAPRKEPLIRPSATFNPLRRGEGEWILFFGFLIRFFSLCCSYSFCRQERSPPHHRNFHAIRAFPLRRGHSPTPARRGGS